MTTNEEPAERLRVSAARLHVVLVAIDWWQSKRPGEKEVIEGRINMARWCCVGFGLAFIVIGLLVEIPRLGRDENASLFTCGLLLFVLGMAGMVAIEVFARLKQEEEGHKHD